MKKAVAALALLLTSGCTVVPAAYAPPPVYVHRPVYSSPPAVIFAPRPYYGHYHGHRHYRRY